MAAFGCSRVREALLGFVESTLDPQTRNGFEAHVCSCESCGRVVAEYRQAIAICSKVFRREPAVGTTEKTLASLRIHTQGGASVEICCQTDDAARTQSPRA